MLSRCLTLIVAAATFTDANALRAEDTAAHGAVFHADRFEPPNGESDWIRLTQDVRALETEEGQLAAGAAASAASRRRTDDLLTSAGVSASLIASSRSRKAAGIAIGTQTLLNSDARRRPSTDGGGFIARSSVMLNVTAQKRNSISNDVRARGARVGDLVASGSFWMPARADLDTMLNKIDSRELEYMTVIKGPYSVRNGPGHSFVEFELLGAPRYENGFESHTSTSVEYKTNGEQWYGRESVSAGSTDWGFRVSDGIRSGVDYRTGNSNPIGGFRLPSGYKSNDVHAVFGFNPTSGSQIDFHYLRLDQADVEYAGQIYDINELVTNAYELHYVATDLDCCDRLYFETWYNRTRFDGDTTRSGKQAQLAKAPPDFLGTPTSLVDRFEGAFTEAALVSIGYSLALTWHDQGGGEWTIGTDLRHIKQELTDQTRTIITAVNPPVEGFVNNAIAPAISTNPGLFMDRSIPWTDQLTVTCGARMDYAKVEEIETVPVRFDPVFFNPPLVTGGPNPITEREFFLGSAYVQGDYRLNPEWTLSGGFGYGSRLPTITELHSFFNRLQLLQTALAQFAGNFRLQAPKAYQIDIGAQADYGAFRMGASGFHQWVADYITYDVDFIGGFTSDGDRRGRYVNTKMATLAGFEAWAERDVNPNVTLFGNMSFVEGRDHSRRAHANIPDTILGLPIGLFFTPEDLNALYPASEPLPGIPPLEARVGVRLHSATPDRSPPRPNARQRRRTSSPARPTSSWSTELLVRMVARQDRVARSLQEQPTPGFTVVNLRGFWNASENLKFIAGVENIGDLFYREHLDPILPGGVFQPGVNFYFGTEIIN